LGMKASQSSGSSFGVNMPMAVPESGDVVEALLGRLGPLAKLPAARGLHWLQLNGMHIMPRSIPALALLFPLLHTLHLYGGIVDPPILAAAVQWTGLEQMVLKYDIDLNDVLIAACVYVQTSRRVAGGPPLVIIALVPYPHVDFDMLKDKCDALLNAIPGQRLVCLVPTSPEFL